MSKDHVTKLADAIGMSGETSAPSWLTQFAARHGLSIRIADQRLVPQGTAIRVAFVDDRSGHSEVIPADITLGEDTRWPPRLGDVLLSVQKMAVLGSLPVDDLEAFCGINGIDIGQVAPALEGYAKVADALSFLLTRKTLDEFLTQAGDAPEWHAALQNALESHRRR